MNITPEQELSLIIEILTQLDVPAEEAMVGGLGGQRFWVAGQDLITDRGKSLPKNLTDVRMPTAPANDGLD